MSELDALAADIRWIRRNIENHDTIMVEIFDRLRKIETDLASMQAKQKPSVNSWTMISIIVTLILGTLVVLDRLYISQ